MKKLLFVFSALALVLGSCSKSDPATVAPEDPAVIVPPVVSNILVSKIVTSSSGQINTENNTYNGNKLLEVVSTDGDKTKYTYTGNLITKIEEFSGTTLNYSETLTYNTDEKLSTYVKIDYNALTSINGFKVVYTYDNIGNILFTAFTGTAASQTIQNNTGKAFVTSGSITKIENYYPPNVLGSQAYTTTATITYDDKIFSGINVTGFNKLTLQGTDLGFGGSTHNIAIETIKNGAVLTSTDESTYTYNANNFPITEININKSYNTNGQVVNTASLSNAIFY